MPGLMFRRRATARLFGPSNVPVPGSEKGVMPRALIVGEPNWKRHIEITVLLRPSQRVSAEKHLSIDDLGMLTPNDRPYLTREAFGASRGADPADVRAVELFGIQHGLRVVGVHSAAREVFLAGSIANAHKAFRTPLAIYRHPGGAFRGRTGPVHVPVDLEGIVQGVFGIDNRPSAETHFRRKYQLGGAWSPKDAAGRAVGVTYPPPEVAKLYKFPTGVTGAGQCIGIIELGGGFRPADLKTYFTKLGIPLPQVVAVSVNGGQNLPTGNPNGPDGEVMLDIEVAGSVAPGARIVVYFTPNTDQGFVRAINRAVHDKINRPSIISISWGGPESSYTQQSLQAFNQAFQAAGQMGVTVCVAAGDDGSSDGVPGKLAHVDFPASSPYVLACGGTTLASSGGAITSEHVWNDGPQGGATGGGISAAFPLPSWQAKANVPPSHNPGGFVGRGLPDVAANADENTGYQVRVDGVDTVIGGTSAVAPLMSGLVALLNQALGTPLGYLNPLIYGKLNAGGEFNDITQGNNDMTGLVGAYNAGPGWDACSGFGSPDGGAILAALQSLAKGALTTKAAAFSQSEESSSRSKKKEG